MTIVCLGLSYHKTSVELRECLNFAPAALKETLDNFEYRPSDPIIEELLVLSTCNRVELYASVPEAAISGAQGEFFPFLVKFMAKAHHLPVERFIAHLYQFTDMEAARHLFRVAAGLDSMVLGEPQILGQVTDAFERAQQQHTAGPVLRALFKTAVCVGKRARTETDIARYPASISSTAVWLAQNIVGDLGQARALVIGTGAMGKLALKALGHRRTGQISLINRTFEKADQLARQYGVEAHRMSELSNEVAQADIIISATGADDFILNAGLIAAAMARRPSRKMVLVDVAVPRDIDPAASHVPGVHMLDVDDLQGRVDDTLAERQKAVPHVEKIIQAELINLEEKLRQLTVRPVIVEMRQKAEEIRQRELERTRRFIPDLDPDTWQHVEILSQSLVNKLLHEPTTQLRQEASNGRSAEFVEAMRQLFGLKESA